MRQDELDRELDRGELTELPENVPPGFLGEVAPDMRKVESFKPSLNAGIIQETTSETRWLTIALLYLLVFTSPAAFYLLWRDAKRSRRAKIVLTALMLLGYAAVFLYVRTRG
jgi:hypothetical protein